MKKKKDNRGGARPGSGKKPTGKPAKIPITLYIDPETIEKRGGKEAFRATCYVLIDRMLEGHKLIIKK